MGRLQCSEESVLGSGEGTFIVAEAGVNHDGDLEQAESLVDVAADAGVDAVKFQTFQSDKLVTDRAEKAEYQRQQTGAGESQLEMLRRLELEPGMHERLQEKCRDRGVLFLSSPFDRDSADLLEELGVPAFKIGSGELTNLPFVRHVAEKQQPMLVSTGMAYLGEVETIVRAIEDEENEEIVLMHCVTNYPASPEATNLRAIDTISEAFGYPVGLSDHTLGIEIPIAAVARGAEIIEKHFTLDRGLSGPDHAASLEPDELERMVESIRNVESALGDGRKRPAAEERQNMEVVRKSIVAAERIPEGSQLTSERIALRRPGRGLAPSMVDRLTGRVAIRDIDEGEYITLDSVRSGDDVEDVDG